MRKLLLLAIAVMFLPLANAQEPYGFTDVTRLQLIDPYKYFPTGGCRVPDIEVISSFPLDGWKVEVDSYVWGRIFTPSGDVIKHTKIYDLEFKKQIPIFGDYWYRLESENTDVDCGRLTIKIVNDEGRIATVIYTPAISDVGLPYTIRLEYPSDEIVNTTGCGTNDQYVCYKNSFTNVVAVPQTSDLSPDPNVPIEIQFQGVYDNSSDIVVQIRMYSSDGENTIRYNGNSYLSSPADVIPSSEYNVSLYTNPEGDFVATVHYTMPSDYKVIKSCAFLWERGFLIPKIANALCIYIGSGEVDKDNSYLYVTPEFIDLNSTNENLIIEAKPSFKGAFMSYYNFSVVRLHNVDTGEDKYFVLWHSYLPPEHVYQLMINSGNLRKYLGVGTWHLSILYYNPFCANRQGLDGCWEEFNTSTDIYNNTQFTASYLKPSNLYATATFNGTILHVEAYFTDNETGEPIDGATCTVNPILEIDENQYSGLGVYPISNYDSQNGYYYDDIDIGTFDKDYTLYYRVDCEADKGQYYYMNTYVGEIVVKPVASYGYEQLVQTGSVVDIIFQSNILYIIFAAGLGAAASKFNPVFGYFTFLGIMIVLTAKGYVSIIYTLPIVLVSLSLLLVLRRRQAV